jgi:Domain of unknown function (DUF4440)
LHTGQFAFPARGTLEIRLGDDVLIWLVHNPESELTARHEEQDVSFGHCFEGYPQLVADRVRNLLISYKFGEKTMRAGASAAFLIASMVWAVPGISQTLSDNDTRELMHLEDVWNQAHLSGDAEALGHLWADDLEIAVPHMAVMTRIEALSFARSGRMKFLRYETSDQHIRVYGDAAVVTGHLLRTRILNGNKVSDDWHFTKVYIRLAHEWRVVSFQASDSPVP